MVHTFQQVAHLTPETKNWLINDTVKIKVAIIRWWIAQNDLVQFLPTCCIPVQSLAKTLLFVFQCNFRAIQKIHNFSGDWRQLPLATNNRTHMWIPYMWLELSVCCPMQGFNEWKWKEKYLLSSSKHYYIQSFSLPIWDC